MVICHIRFAGMHFAIGKTTTVAFSQDLCPSSLVPGRSGACEPCPNGTQPLSQGIPPGAQRLTDAESVSMKMNPLCIPCPRGLYSPVGRECLLAEPGLGT